MGINLTYNTKISLGFKITYLPYWIFGISRINKRPWISSFGSW